MLPVGEARRSSPIDIVFQHPGDRNGRIVREQRRMTSVIRELKRRHAKKSRAFGKAICRERD
jgi:hypothetical protein